MKTTYKLLLLTLLIAAILIPQAAQASGLMDDKVVFGGNYTLSEGETLNGDLVVFGGNATIERGSTVNGDVVIMGGSADIDGTINGTLVSMGGYLKIKANAQINGELTALGSSIERSEEAQINGNIVTSEDIPFEFDFPRGITMPKQFSQAFQYTHNPLTSGAWFLFQVLIWTGAAILLTLFFQKQTETVSQTALEQPTMSAGIGLLIVILTPVVLLLLIVTILLSPLVIAAIPILFIAWLFGWAALGLEVGKRLMKATNQIWSPALYAGLGMFILSLIFNGFQEVVPCVGGLPKFFAGMWMLGAVALTKFGTQKYAPAGVVPASPAPVPVPAAPQLPEDFPAEEIEPQEEIPSPEGEESE